MITRTFRHIPGVGEKLERKFWDSGCYFWDDFLLSPPEFQSHKVTADEIRISLERSKQALDSFNHREFLKLGVTESWRAFPTFEENIMYLDIETDGGQHGDCITTIGMYDGFDFKCLVKGQDLDDFPDMIRDVSMLVTFYGSAFDVPMLKRRFPQIEFDQLHLDLCFAFRKIGVRGGLKKIEKHFEIARSDETDGLSGYDAVRLWNAYLRGSDRALETLIEYNREDVVNLQTLARICYAKLEEDLCKTCGLQLSSTAARS